MGVANVAAEEGSKQMATSEGENGSHIIRKTTSVRHGRRAVGKTGKREQAVGNSLATICCDPTCLGLRGLQYEAQTWFLIVLWRHMLGPMKRLGDLEQSVLPNLVDAPKVFRRHNAAKRHTIQYSKGSSLEPSAAHQSG